MIRSRCGQRRDRELGAHLGLEPVGVSSENRGYDIESRDSDSGRLRFIEVKGGRAAVRDFSITRDAMLAIFNASESFILAVPLVDGTFAQHLFTSVSRVALKVLGHE